MSESRLPRLLIVDDDQDIREALCEVLEPEGFEVECAVNGAEAIQLIREQGRFDLIVLDLMMPVMNGEEFLTEMRRLSPELPSSPVVAMSAGEYNARVYDLGAQCFLRKPLDLKVLIREVQRCIRECDSPGASCR